MPQVDRLRRANCSRGQGAKPQASRRQLGCQPSELMARCQADAVLAPREPEGLALISVGHASRSRRVSQPAPRTPGADFFCWGLRWVSLLAGTCMEAVHAVEVELLLWDTGPSPQGDDGARVSLDGGGSFSYYAGPDIDQGDNPISLDLTEGTYWLVVKAVWPEQSWIDGTCASYYCSWRHTARFYIDFRGFGAHPVALDDAAAPAEDEPVTIQVLSNDEPSVSIRLDGQEDSDPSAGGAATESETLRRTTGSCLYCSSGGYPETQTFRLDLDVRDTDLSVTAATQPSNGTTSIGPEATSVTYTPAPDWCGSDTFTYYLSDGHGGTDTADVQVTVTCVNDPPLARDDSVATCEKTMVRIAVLGNDSDIDGGIDPSTVTLSQRASHGTADVDSRNGEVRYTPSPGFSGTDTFCYTVRDGVGARSREAVVTVSVDEVSRVLTLETSPGSCGMTTPAAGTHVFRVDAVVEVRATAQPGYLFDRWEGIVADPSAATTTVSMTSDATVCALFSPTRPSLRMIQEAYPASAGVGDTITFLYTVVNTGNVPLTDIEAADALLSAIELPSTTLAPGERTTGSSIYVVRPADPPLLLTNAAEVVGTSPLGEVISARAVQMAVSLEPSAAPAIVAVATAAPDAAQLGDAISYSYAVTNESDTSVSGVSIVDTLLGKVNLEPASLAPGETAVGTADYVIQEADLPGPLNSVATASATDPFGLVAYARATATVTLTKTPGSTNEESRGVDGQGASTTLEILRAGTVTNQQGESIEVFSLAVASGTSPPTSRDEIRAPANLPAIACRTGESLRVVLMLSRDDVETHVQPLPRIMPQSAPPLNRREQLRGPTSRMPSPSPATASAMSSAWTSTSASWRPKGTSSRSSAAVEGQSSYRSWCCRSAKHKSHMSVGRAILPQSSKPCAPSNRHSQSCDRGRLVAIPRNTTSPPAVLHLSLRQRLLSGRDVHPTRLRPRPPPCPPRPRSCANRKPQ